MTLVVNVYNLCLDTVCNVVRKTSFFLSSQKVVLSADKWALRWSQKMAQRDNNSSGS